MPKAAEFARQDARQHGRFAPAIVKEPQEGPRRTKAHHVHPSVATARRDASRDRRGYVSLHPFYLFCGRPRGRTRCGGAGRADAGRAVARACGRRAPCRRPRRCVSGASRADERFASPDTEVGGSSPECLPCLPRAPRSLRVPTP
ncbi:hypothetical protein AMAG_19975 [Allomyces macrogynus ATCC 38327]|uniref:Uncharacterized protein n=1 Tax=Allomyces macrogynus (strain ATCC 38327) TaxID=578462 RepID=A0A0L0T3P1_ALLM3|nr:hypothetical protein AMAG_19975 [Allomyces macrogynus ATCC 38327]|eukprot:KNE69174.1 hypothetical protein AMAG_19975 [Allomyces macrogynus ATCC 38327]